MGDKLDFVDVLDMCSQEQLMGALEFCIENNKNIMPIFHRVNEELENGREILVRISKEKSIQKDVRQDSFKKLLNSEGNERFVKKVFLDENKINFDSISLFSEFMKKEELAYIINSDTDAEERPVTKTSQSQTGLVETNRPN